MSQPTIKPNAVNGIVEQGGVQVISSTEAVITLRVTAPADRISELREFDSYNLELTSGLDGQPSGPV